MLERWVRGSVALLVLTACSSSAPAPDASDGGAPDTPAAETGLPDVPADRAETRSDGGLCLQTNDRATIALHLPGGELRNCANSSFDATPAESWVGKVTASDAGSITVEVCGGEAGCVPSALVVEASAPGLDLSRFPHVPVRVRARFERFYKCQASVEITMDDPIDGGASPDGGESREGRLLLAVVDGGTTFAGSPYTVEHTKLDCPGIDGGPFGQAGKYAFDFSSASAPAPVRVHMGETATWLLDGTSMTVRNLRSFESGNFDDYWDWAYTIYADPPR